MSIQMKINGILARDIEELDVIGLDSTSQEYQLMLENNSAMYYKKLRLHITPTDLEKFNRLMFYSDQYVDAGLFIQEDYTIIGEISKVVNNIYLEDRNLDFDFDFLAGETINLLTPVPQTIAIDSFDYEKRRFKLAADPSTSPEGYEYRVTINRANKFTSLNGRPILYPIRLITRSGRLSPGQSIILKMYFKTGPFAFIGEDLPFRLTLEYDNA